ncbi:MAG TPA: hypothetical protein VN976_08095 [Verrucomicrobiae bacterium]|nr:hypothetical protein [Verrucomicrobiae bacterium]
MAAGTQGNQVFSGIITGLAAEFLVVNLKIRHRAAGLASPAIPAEYLVAQFFVQLGIKPQAWAFRRGPVHDAFPLK